MASLLALLLVLPGLASAAFTIASDSGCAIEDESVLANNAPAKNDCAYAALGYVGGAADCFPTPGTLGKNTALSTCMDECTAAADCLGFNFNYGAGDASKGCYLMSGTCTLSENTKNTGFAKGAAATDAPTDAATEPPTAAPTAAATDAATDAPTDAAATDAPTDAATATPTATPTAAATDAATDAPTDAAATATPTAAATNAATDVPTDAAATDPPTDAATDPPTDAATDPPTDAATDPPTDAATDPPTASPTFFFDLDNTDSPTTEPPTSRMENAYEECLIGDGLLVQKEISDYCRSNVNQKCVGSDFDPITDFDPTITDFDQCLEAFEESRQRWGVKNKKLKMLGRKAKAKKPYGCYIEKKQMYWNDGGATLRGKGSFNFVCDFKPVEPVDPADPANLQSGGDKKCGVDYDVEGGCQLEETPEPCVENCTSTDLSTGAIVGIVLGSVAFLAFAGFAVVGMMGGD